jgi:hypothetical protein
MFRMSIMVSSQELKHNHSHHYSIRKTKVQVMKTMELLPL